MRVQAITPDSNHAAVDYLKGFSIQEDSSGAAFVTIRKAAAGGAVVFNLRLAADESASIVFPEVLSCEGGCYVNEEAGSVAGVLYY